MNYLLLVAVALPFAGCGDTGTSPAPPAQSRVLAPSVTTDPPLALGLTRRQIEDADLIDASGREIGEIERALSDASGAVTGLLVEVEDTNPDRLVTIPLDGLTIVENGDDLDVRTNLTRDALMALPETPRQPWRSRSVHPL